MLDFAIADIIGSIGVALLLAAFGLNLNGTLNQNQITYLIMNFLGAGLATLASWMIDYMPFVLLEGTWCLVSAVGLISTLRPSKMNRK
ncbi:MAG: hypothetical protein Pars92KO_23990 [Parasphingorhabdus sp.]